MNNKKDFEFINNRVNSLSFAERVSRMILMTTIVVGLYFLYKNLFNWVANDLTTEIPLKTLISVEHIAASTLMSSGILFFIYTFWYFYCELLTLNHIYKTDPISQKIIQNSQRAYANLFDLVKLCIINSIVTIVISGAVITYITKNYLGIGFFSCLLLIFLVAIINPKTRKLVNKEIIIRFFKTNKELLPIWLAITFCMFFSIVLIMGAHYKPTFKINFSSNSNLPISFHFENSVPNDIHVSFYFVDQENNSHLTKEMTISKTDFQISSIEVTKKPSESKNDLSWLKIIDVIDTEVKKSQQTTLIFDRSREDYKYTLNSFNYVKKGRNIINIQFISRSGLNDKFYNIKNQIDVDEQGVHITTKNFD